MTVDRDRIGIEALPPEKLLLGLLRQGFNGERADAIVHAIVDIGGSMDKLYGTLLPDLVAALDAPQKEFQEKLWAIREEFRHVEYHMNDGKLTEL